jgi:hypothetical protein
VPDFCRLVMLWVQKLTLHWQRNVDSGNTRQKMKWRKDVDMSCKNCGRKIVEIWSEWQILKERGITKCKCGEPIKEILI